MSNKNKLTNEELTKHSNNNFELTKRGVELARNMIHNIGEAPLLKVIDELKKKVTEESNRSD
ncbi:MAG: hypothetical protein MRY21_04950 [Simkaniaceae bacterium]|nr:hypothetical protein [Simkaniaceae bacterium]